MDRRAITGTGAAALSTSGCAALWASLSSVLPPGTQLLASYAGTGMVSVGGALLIYLWITAGTKTKKLETRRAQLVAFSVEAENLQRRWEVCPTDHVGVEPAGAARMALTGWSLQVGDFRPSHFFATHMIQALPLGGLLAARALTAPAATAAVLSLA